MARQAKLRKKNGYWYTKAGTPNGVYFGRLGVMTYPEAKAKFAEYLNTLQSARPQTRGDKGELSTAELVDLFLDWVQAHRSDRTYDERKRHLQRFVDFNNGTQLVGDVPATGVQASDLSAFLAALKAKHDLDPFTVDKHAVSIKAAFHWGTKHPSPTPHLPPGFRPFTSIEKYKQPLDPLLEDDLPTADEVTALLKCADADLALMCEKGRYRRRRPEEYRAAETNPYAGFEDLLRVYWHTGARTSELAGCLVGDFVRGTRQIVLGRHKRSKTMKDPAVRRITLNGEAFSILEKWCRGKKASDPIFTDPHKRPWTRYTLDNRFKQVRERAVVRDAITIYSFRHLWISEMLMAGVDVATLAKMAGTSIAMIERVYGHFTNEHFLDAQGRLDAARQVKVESAKAGSVGGGTATVAAESTAA